MLPTMSSSIDMLSKGFDTRRPRAFRKASVPSGADLPRTSASCTGGYANSVTRARNVVLDPATRLNVSRARVNARAKDARRHRPFGWRSSARPTRAPEDRPVSFCDGCVSTLVKRHAIGMMQQRDIL